MSETIDFEIVHNKFEIEKKFYDESFLHQIEANLFLFGYLGGNFFSESYEDSGHWFKNAVKKEKEVEKEKEMHK